MAASFGKYKEVEDLLKDSDCDVNFRNTESGGKTPLYIAASWGSLDHIRVIELLLTNCAKIDLPNGLSQTPLYVAASWGNAQVVLLLIERGANVNLANHGGRTPLHITTYKKPHQTLSTYTNDSTFMLYNVAKMCMATSLRNYSSYLPNLDEDYNILLNTDVSGFVRLPDAALETVIYYNHFAVTVALVEAGAFINAIDGFLHTPLDNACIWGHGAIKQYLVTKGAVKRKDLCLYIAAYYGKYEDVEKLLKDPDCDVNFRNTVSGGNTPLYHAACWGSPDHIKVIDLLLEHGADIDLSNDLKQTPLYVAASWGNAHVVSHLIEKGANVNLENHERRTPLHIATCPKPHLDEISDFTKLKYSIYTNWSTFMLYNVAKMCMATSLRNYSSCLPNLDEDYNMLLNLDVSNSFRLPDRALETVVYYNHFAVTVELVRVRASINPIDEFNHTPLDNACIWGHEAIKQYLVANGAVKREELNDP